MLQIYQPLSLDLPTIVSGFTYRHLSIYLPSFRDLPTIAAGFTYCHSYLPTVVSSFTYCRLQIYLLSFLYLPTVVSGFTYRFLQIYLPLSQLYLPFLHKSYDLHGDPKKIHMVIIFWFYHGDHFLMLIIFCTPLYSSLTKQLCHSIYIFSEGGMKFF